LLASKLSTNAKFARFKFKDFSRIFKYFQSPYLFSSTFKGLEVFIPNSSIFKDFSSTLNPVFNVAPLGTYRIIRHTDYWHNITISALMSRFQKVLLVCNGSTAKLKLKLNHNDFSLKRLEACTNAECRRNWSFQFT